MTWNIAASGTKEQTKSKVERATIGHHDPGRPQFDRVKAFLLSEIVAAGGDSFSVNASGHTDDLGSFLTLSTSSGTTLRVEPVLRSVPGDEPSTT